MAQVQGPRNSSVIPGARIHGAQIMMGPKGGYWYLRGNKVYYINKNHKADMARVRGKPQYGPQNNPNPEPPPMIGPKRRPPQFGPRNKPAEKGRLNLSLTGPRYLPPRQPAPTVVSSTSKMVYKNPPGPISVSGLGPPPNPKITSVGPVSGPKLTKAQEKRQLTVAWYRGTPADRLEILKKIDPAYYEILSTPELRKVFHKSSYGKEFHLTTAKLSTYINVEVGEDEYSSLHPGGYGSVPGWKDYKEACKWFDTKEYLGRLKASISRQNSREKEKTPPAKKKKPTSGRTKIPVVEKRVDNFQNIDRDLTTDEVFSMEWTANLAQRFNTLEARRRLTFLYNRNPGRVIVLARSKKLGHYLKGTAVHFDKKYKNFL